MREERGSRQPMLSRARIAEAAISIADSEGFEAVSMRHVAELLGVGTMSLYYHVKTKGELLALMDDALMAQNLLPVVTKTGGAGLFEIAMNTCALLLRHPWALFAMRGSSPGPNTARHVEQCLEVLADTKLSLKEKMRLLDMVDDFVFGYVLRETESREEVDPEFGQALLETGEFPELAKAYRKDFPISDPKRIERGLKAIIGSVLPL
jgi:AcrR family transcriptional regulator